jgi:hypothetical protein
MKRKISKKSVLHKTYHFLKLVSQLPAQSRRVILKNTRGDPAIYKSLRELGINYLKGNIKLNKKHLKGKDSKFLSTITKPENKTRSCSCDKRSTIVQKGDGFLGLLAPALISLAASLFTK